MSQVITAFWNDYGTLLIDGTVDTLIMTSISTLLAYVIGLPIGVIFCLTQAQGLHPNKPVNAITGWIVNIGRSIPFIILLVAIIPFTRLIAGTSLGIPGAVVPLVVSAAPFVGRIVEQSITEVDAGLIEAAQSFGASTWRIITRVMLPESLPSLIRGAGITFINLFGYSAMAGTVGAGGLGDIAIRYGYQRYEYDVMLVAVVLCVILVQIIQSITDSLAAHVDHKHR